MNTVIDYFLDFQLALNMVHALGFCNPALAGEADESVYLQLCL